MARKPGLTAGDKRLWANRIVGHAEVHPSELSANPANWRVHPEHQAEALTGVLDQVGWVQSVVVNKRSGLVVDGHLRVALALTRGEMVPVVYVDLSDEDERLILASLDPLASLAITDEAKLSELLSSVDASNEALDRMLYSLLDQASQAALHDEPSDESAVESESGNERNLGDKRHQIKPVLYADQVATFEQAVRATGLKNRGESIIAICKFYLDAQERQFDFRTEGEAA